MKRTILVVSVIIIVILVNILFERYKESKEKVNIGVILNSISFKNFLFVGNDSLATSNRAKNFGEIISGNFNKYINFSAPGIFNKTFSFKSIIQHNLNIEEIKLLQQLSTEQIQKDLGMLKVMLNASDMQKENGIKPGDRAIRLASELENADANSYFIITTGANDLMHSLNADSLSIVLDKQKRIEALEKIKNSGGTDKIVSGVIENVSTVIMDVKSVNPNIKIMVLGLYLPNYIQFFEKLYGCKYSSELIEQYNLQLKNMCTQYNVVYIDITEVKDHTAMFDFHPNKLGQLIIARTVLQSIADYDLPQQSITNISDKFIVDNKGLGGMFTDAQMRLEITEKRNDLTERDQRDKIIEYITEIDLIKEAMIQSIKGI